MAFCPQNKHTTNEAIKENTKCIVTNTHFKHQLKMGRTITSLPNELANPVLNRLIVDVYVKIL